MGANLFDPDDDFELFVHQYDPPGRLPGICWVAELRERTGMMSLPVAVAYLSDVRPVGGMVLDFIFVPDQWRQHGFASRLIRLLECRWPDLELTDPISPAGEGLVRSLTASGLRLADLP